MEALLFVKRNNVKQDSKPRLNTRSRERGWMDESHKSSKREEIKKLKVDMGGEVFTQQLRAKRSFLIFSDSQCFCHTDV